MSGCHLPVWRLRDDSRGRWGLRHMSISEHKHMPEAIRRIEVFTGAGRRRSWSPGEKASIVAESYGETVCAVARRHGLTPQQLFTWRRLARVAPTSEAPVMFVPAMVETTTPEPTAVVTSPRRTRRRSTASGIELEIGGVAVRVGADANPQAIAAVIRALKASS
jgi:transposase